MYKKKETKEIGEEERVELSYQVGY